MEEEGASRGTLLTKILLLLIGANVPCLQREVTSKRLSFKVTVFTESILKLLRILTQKSYRPA